MLLVFLYNRKNRWTCLFYKKPSREDRHPLEIGGFEKIDQTQGKSCQIFYFRV